MQTFSERVPLELMDEFKIISLLLLNSVDKDTWNVHLEYFLKLWNDNFEIKISSKDHNEISIAFDDLYHYHLTSKSTSSGSTPFFSISIIYDENNRFTQEKFDKILKKKNRKF